MSAELSGAVLVACVVTRKHNINEGGEGEPPEVHVLHAVGSTFLTKGKFNGIWLSYCLSGRVRGPCI